MEQKVRLLYGFQCFFFDYKTWGETSDTPAGIYIPDGSIGTIIKDYNNGAYDIQFTIESKIPSGNNSYRITVVKSMTNFSFEII